MAHISDIVIIQLMYNYDKIKMYIYDEQYNSNFKT